MSARVLFRDSQGRDGQVDLNPSSPLYVGRALDCAIRTDDAMVSRKHSMIRMENGRFYVEDLGSSNGTHVNDVRVTKHLLNHNDVVRCGSLWLRYVEDAPVQAAASAQPQPSQPKRGGTIRLDPQGSPGAGSAAGYGAAAGYGGGAQPGMSAAAGQPESQLGSRTAAGGYGQGQPGGAGASAGVVGAGVSAGPAGVGASPSAAAPSGAGSNSTAYGKGAATAAPNGDSAQARSGGQGHEPFGGPPPMPEGVVGGDFHTPPRQAAPNVVGESSVVVDMAAGDGPAPADPDEVAKVKHELQSALAHNEELQANYDREVADGKRLRAEIVTHKDRVDELRRALNERDEIVEAHGRVADELREEIRQAKDALAASRSETAELSDLVAARERQISRAQEDIGQLKGEIEDKERQLAEVQRTKDEGWKKLNEQLTEIEHLREVITQQERMLEERRVGLVSQEEIIKELRSEKENHLRTSAQMKAERDELKADLIRLQAQIGAIDEENRRLTQLLAEARARGGASGATNHEVAAQTQAASAELKTLRIALKTVESERDHQKDLVERTQDEVERLRERIAGLEVDLRESNEKFEQVNAGKSVSDDAMARAELARHKAAEEVVAASKAREEAERRAEQALRELDKVRAQLATIDKDTSPSTDQIEELAERARKLERQLQDANDRIGQLEAELRTSNAERDAERKSRSFAAVTAEDVESTAVVTADMNPAKIKDRAIEVHDAINDVLSELRNNAMILQDSFQDDPAERSEETVRIMRDAIDSVVGQAEEAKGTLRRLRELVEFGGE